MKENKKCVKSIELSTEKDNEVIVDDLELELNECTEFKENCMECDEDDFEDDFEEEYEESYTKYKEECNEDCSEECDDEEDLYDYDEAYHYDREYYKQLKKEEDLKRNNKNSFLREHVLAIGMIFCCIICFIALIVINPKSGDLIKNPDLYHFTSTQSYLFIDAIDESVKWDNEKEYSNRNIWTTGKKIYYSDKTNNIQCILNEEKRVWDKIAWENVDKLDGNNIWTNGTNIYYSEIISPSKSKHYVFDLEKENWKLKKWNGLNDFNGYDVWTDGLSIYYSDGLNHYKLNEETSTWSKIDWNGLTNFTGRNVGLKDGSYIACLVENSWTGETDCYKLTEDETWKLVEDTEINEENTETDAEVEVEDNSEDENKESKESEEKSEE